MTFIFLGGGVVKFFKELCPQGDGGGGEGVEEEEEIGKLFLPPPFLRQGWGEKARRCKKRLLLLLLSPVSQRQKRGRGGGRSMRFLRRIGASEAKRSREVPLPPFYTLEEGQKDVPAQDAFWNRIPPTFFSYCIFIAVYWNQRCSPNIQLQSAMLPKLFYRKYHLIIVHFFNWFFIHF